MPLPRSGEKLSSFIERFIGSKREKKEFPNIKQRLAIGYSEAREFSKRASSANAKK